MNGGPAAQGIARIVGGADLGCARFVFVSDSGATCEGAALALAGSHA
jgi:hypothetical protein